MNKVINFLKSEYRVFIALIYALCTFGGIFLLAKLKVEYYFLGLEIIIFGLFLYLFFQWFNYIRKEKLSDEVARLKKENKLLENKRLNDKKDLEEYFLLWVHQIKTPITISKLVLQKLDIKEVDTLNQQIFYIEEYTNMAINYLKLKGREADMDISEVKLDIMIRPLLKKYSMMFIHKNISLEYTAINNEVIVDQKWFSIMLEQILANALKYTENGKIYVLYDEKSNRLEIKDTGIGIRSEDLKKIFERGYSGFNGRINEKSSGLGLYLVKNIAQLLNVKVEVASKLHEGSSFYIYFPRNLTNL